ncbi:MAG: hypothetical protein WDN47_04955 [Candidatus Doudnabacteria bacterium]
MNRRGFFASLAALLTSACSSLKSTTAPTSTTPLLTMLQRDGYTVVERKNLDGGVYLVINGKIPRIRVGASLIGIDQGLGLDPVKSGPPTLNVGKYQVPENLGYILEPV